MKRRMRALGNVQVQILEAVARGVVHGFDVMDEPASCCSKAPSSPSGVLGVVLAGAGVALLLRFQPGGIFRLQETVLGPSRGRGGDARPLFPSGLPVVRHKMKLTPRRALSRRTLCRRLTLCRPGRPEASLGTGVLFFDSLTLDDINARRYHSTR